MFEIPVCSSLKRCSFLQTTSLAAAAVWSGRALGVAQEQVPLTGCPFQLGLTSGDPAPDGMVLWTRLVPRPLEAEGGMPPVPVKVDWMIA